MSAPVLWTCELLQAEGLTIGSKFHLKCLGTLEVSLEKTLKLNFPEGVNPKTLKILNVLKKGDKELELVVTSHLPGEHKIKFLQITDGTNVVESGELQWSVASVLTQESQPFPPKGPMALDFPQVILYSILLFSIAMIALISYAVVARKKRTRLLKDLETYSSSLNPKNQFEKTLRQLRQSLNWSDRLNADDAKQKVETLDIALRVALLRQFEVQTFGLKPNALFSLIKTRAPSTDLKNWNALFKELYHLQHEGAKVDKEALTQLIDMSQKLVGHL